MSNPFDTVAMIKKIAADGARVHQLRFARERLEKLRRELGKTGLTAWIEDVDYALAQIRAAESTL